MKRRWQVGGSTERLSLPLLMLEGRERAGRKVGISTDSECHRTCEEGLLCKMGRLPIDP